MTAHSDSGIALALPVAAGRYWLNASQLNAKSRGIDERRNNYRESSSNELKLFNVCLKWAAKVRVNMPIASSLNTFDFFRAMESYRERYFMMTLRYFIQI